MTAEEENTWKSIQQKNGQEFEKYYKEHYKPFFLVAFNYLKDRGQAEETVNDVFVRLWQGAPSLRVESSLKSYIYRAVINTSLNKLAKNKKDLQHQRELGRRPEETVESKQIEDNELKISLYKAIDQLPEQCRKVFQLSRFEELKQQEIADRLGISIKTVKNHITHALKQLNKTMGEWHSLPLWMIILKNLFCR
jgi:RNA polymerase sigma-70 factor (family 1)